ncbi:MAG TPA: GNAT family N-acetyltransferase [Acetobacteraceae bacterium]|nr:GNAT family N-acetyltransferase [Acetobacteraceae bacterium]
MTGIIDNPALRRFEMHVEGAIAFVEYARDGDRLVLIHTEIPESLGGRGIGSALARAVLEHLRAEGVRARVRCDFLARFVQRHPEFGDVVETG